ncbi:MAG: hypothetical protein WKF75_10455 [Singulisphaera sp.]
MRRDYTIPLIDLAPQQQRQVVVDREPGSTWATPPPRSKTAGRSRRLPQGMGMAPSC